MAQNTAPIYVLNGDIQWTAGITAANTATDGTGTVSTIFTATSNGSFVQKIRFRALGNCTNTVGRIFINNGSTNATPANNTLWDEITLASTTSTNTAALPTYELPLNFVLPSGYKINVTLGTAVSAGYSVTVIGGDY